MLFGCSATNSVKCICPGKQTCNITCTQEMETSFSKETHCFETRESKTKTCLSLPITQGTPLVHPDQQEVPRNSSSGKAGRVLGRMPRNPPLFWTRSSFRKTSQTQASISRKHYSLQPYHTHANCSQLLAVLSVILCP